MACFPSHVLRKLVTLLACIAFLHHAYGESADDAGAQEETDTPINHNADAKATDEGSQKVRRVDAADTDELAAQSEDQGNNVQPGADPEGEEDAVLLVTGGDEDELELDASSSIDIVEAVRGVYIGADLRTGFFADENEDFTGETDSSQAWHVRWLRH